MAGLKSINAISHDLLEQQWLSTALDRFFFNDNIFLICSAIGGTLPLVQASRSLAVPSQACLALHDQRLSWSCLEEFLPRLPTETRMGFALGECLGAIHQLGIIEPISGLHLPPEAVKISGSNYRESIEANNLISRHRAMLLVIETFLSDGRNPSDLKVFLGEDKTAFANHLLGVIPNCTTSEFFSNTTDSTHSSANKEDVCNLSYADTSYDLVVYNDVIGLGHSIEDSLGEARRVLKPGGSFLATFPFAYGQEQTIMKQIPLAYTSGGRATANIATLRQQIPGWNIIKQSRNAGFGNAKIHYIASWKHGVLGAELPGIFLLEAGR
jgi:hypothetical protein